MLQVRVAAPGREQPEKVRLARAVGAQHRDSVTEPELAVERLHQPGEFQVGADHGPLTGPAAPQPHLHVLLGRHHLRRAGLLELGQPGLGRGVTRGQTVVEGRLGLVHQHQGLELGVVLVPASAQLLQPGVPFVAGLLIVAEPTAVHPGRGPGPAWFQGDDAGRRLGQQFPVVADQQHRLRGLGQAFLQPALARDVQVVVRLVEQQHLSGPRSKASSTRRFCSPPDRVLIWRHCAFSNGMPSAEVVQTSQRVSAS